MTSFNPSSRNFVESYGATNDNYTPNHQPLSTNVTKVTEQQQHVSTNPGSPDFEKSKVLYNETDLEYSGINSNSNNSTTTSSFPSVSHQLSPQKFDLDTKSLNEGDFKGNNGNHGSNPVTTTIVETTPTKTTSLPPTSSGSADDSTDGSAGGSGSGSGSPSSPTKKRLRPFQFLTTKQFWFILLHGQVLSMCIVSTNTLTSFMANDGVSIPAFQSLFIYILLFFIFVPYTIYRQGVSYFVKNTLLRSGWKYFILAFADCQGNYFIVKAYNYTNILSASLLDNFSIVFVVILSFLFLRVRYHWTQIIGIFVCIGGSVLIVVSDLLTGKNWAPSDPLKGDLFVILSSFCYGLSNVLEEYFVSKKPLYEVVGQLGFYGMFIMGIQCAIFERTSLREAHWTPAVGGYLTGYTFSMLLLYTTAPILFRMSSSAFYNLSLLTSDFWSLLIGIKVFGYYVFWLYPIGFVLTILGVVIYYLVPRSLKGESEKPWLGANQELGISGVGTAKRMFRKDYIDSTSTTTTSDGGEIIVTTTTPVGTNVNGNNPSSVTVTGDANANADSKNDFFTSTKLLVSKVFSK